MERANLAALAMLFAVVGPADAQTLSPDGAFQAMSPGNQKIARALYEAQKPGPNMAPLSLDQIAVQKSGRGWGVVFKQMQTQGLVQDQTLGQVVRTYNQRHGITTDGAPAVTTGATPGRGAESGAAAVRPSRSHAGASGGGRAK